MRKILFIAISLIAASALAENDKDKVYRYTDDKGVVHYTDKPPSKDAKPAQLPKIQTFKSGQPPKGISFSDAPAANVPQFSIAFDSPSPDQTYREFGVAVDVSVNIMPGLIGGYGLMYRVDGEPLNDAPSFSTTMSLPGLERGSHVISVSLVDAKRREQAAASVTVHMKPPTVKQQQQN